MAGMVIPQADWDRVEQNLKGDVASGPAYMLTWKQFEQWKVDEKVSAGNRGHRVNVFFF